MNQTKYWIWGIVAVIVLFGIFFVFKPATQQPGTAQKSVPASGGAYSNTGSVTVQQSQRATTTQKEIKIVGQSNMLITVNDFIHNGETVSDPVNPGTYYLAGSIGYCLGNGTCPSGYASDEFVVTFTTKTQAFNIGLLKEPLNQSRADVEKFLENRLNIPEYEMCGLIYYVRTSNSVNPVYAGENLGFSFCPGATKLAQ